MRLFFALWPDSATRDVLATTSGELRKICGGRAPAAANLHLTLAFLGDVPGTRVPELERLAATLVAAPFVLNLDCIGYWRQQRLVWAGPQSCPRELELLAAALEDGLRAGGFHTEGRRFRAHVTLLRDVRKAPLQTACGPLAWRPTQFVLVSSRPAVRGVHYQLVGGWPLTGAGAGL